MTLIAPFDFFRQVVHFIDPDLSAEAMDFLCQGLKQKNLKAKEYVVDTRKIHADISFVAQGLVRGYYVDSKGNEITTRLIQEGNFATHYRAFLDQQPSKYIFQCLAPCTLLYFNYQHIQKAYKLYPETERFGRLVAEGIINILESRMESFQFMNAEERYLQFINQNPDLFNRISLEHLSSYLGIQRPSLSRIRRKLTQNQ
mgnify:CR=1 FL=1